MIDQRSETLDCRQVSFCWILINISLFTPTITKLDKTEIFSQLKELKERQRQQNKQKAIKLGLDPE